MQKSVLLACRFTFMISTLHIASRVKYPYVVGYKLNSYAPLAINDGNQNIMWSVQLKSSGQVPKTYLEWDVQLVFVKPYSGSRIYDAISNYNLWNFCWFAFLQVTAIASGRMNMEIFTTVPAKVINYFEKNDSIRKTKVSLNFGKNTRYWYKIYRETSNLNYSI